MNQQENHFLTSEEFQFWLKPDQLQVFELEGLSLATCLYSFKSFLKLFRVGFLLLHHLLLICLMFNPTLLSAH
jgi:hypothetical protein